MAEPERLRDPDRSRKAILDAAERLFAERGYRGTSLQEIGEAAGVSRGTPGYFFGSKEELYRAVLERVFSEVREILLRVREEALAQGGTPEEVFARGIEQYIDFLSTHRSFVRLVEWEAVLGGAVVAELSPHLAAVFESMAAIGEELARGHLRPHDPMQLMVSIMGMCWFPLSQAGTLMRVLGQDPCDPEFVELRKRHVVDLVLNGIQSGQEGGPGDEDRS